MFYKSLTTVFCLGAMILVGASLMPRDAAAADKVAICHYPSDDPAKFDVLWVSPTAAESHLTQHAIDRFATNDGRCIYDPI